MIYIIESRGQLGNQLFQFMFIQKIKNNSDIVLMINYKLLKNLLNKDIDKKIIFLNKMPFTFKLIKIINKFFKYKIFSSIDQDIIEVSGLKIHNNKLIKKIGIIKKIVIIEGFFQSYNLINSNYLPKFNSFSNKFKNFDKTCFIHIRKGDYEDFYYNNRTVELSISYYHNAIRFIINEINNIKFMICTNDSHDYINENFKNIKGKYFICDDDPNQTFINMMNCNYGIISNSSFSWMAGYLSQKKHLNSLIIAPKNHLGHNLGIEIPKGIHNPNFKYL